MGAASMTPVPAVLGHGRATPTWEDTHSQSPGPPRPQSHFGGGVLRAPLSQRHARGRPAGGDAPAPSAACDPPAHFRSHAPLRLLAP